MRQILCVFVLLALASGTAALGADPPEVIHYQGVLRDAADAPQTGPFAMTFRFFDDPAAGTEILCDSHTVIASNGLFSTTLGEPAHITACMGSGNEVPMVAAFADSTDLYLQVEIGAEILLPRIRVAASGYALNSRLVRGREIVAAGPIDLYVDASTGDDANDGLSPTSAKQSIQAAIRDIPMLLSGDVQVHIANGTYNERVALMPRMRPDGLHWIRLIGDAAAPNNVVIDGTGLPDPGGNAASEGIWVSDLPVEISGLSMSNFTSAGIGVSFGGFAVIRNCRLQNNQLGLSAEQGGVTDVENVVITDNQIGIGAFNGGNAYLGDGLDISNNTDKGLAASHNSLIEMRGYTTCSITDNDLMASEHSTVSGYGGCTISGSTCNALDATAICRP